MTDVPLLFCWLFSALVVIVCSGYCEILKNRMRGNASTSDTFLHPPADQRKQIITAWAILEDRIRLPGFVGFLHLPAAGSSRNIPPRIQINLFILVAALWILRISCSVRAVVRIIPQWPTGQSGIRTEARRSAPFHVPRQERKQELVIRYQH